MNDDHTNKSPVLIRISNRKTLLRSKPFMKNRMVRPQQKTQSAAADWVF